MIKTIIFDNNGVLTTADSEITLAPIIATLKTTKEELLPLWKKSAEKLDEGGISNRDFMAEIVNKINPDTPKEEVYNLYLKSYEAKEEVRDYAAQLGKIYELAVLTNFGEAFWEFNKRWKLEKIFPKENIFVSADLKMRKPKPEIFREVLKRLDRKSNEVVFIDDNRENIEASQKMGIKSIFFTDLENLKTEMKKIQEGSYV